MQGAVPIPWGSPQYFAHKGGKLKERPSPYEGKGGKVTKGAKGHPGQWSDPADVELQYLIDRVKQIQRRGEEERQKWWNFCDAKGRLHDPSKCEHELLKEFLAGYDVGMDFDPSQVVRTEDDRVLRLRGVPYSSMLSDVVKFVEMYGADDSHVIMGQSDDGSGRLNGEALVIFSDLATAERAFVERQRQEIKGRYIEIYRSNLNEWNLANSARQSIIAVQSEKDRMVEKIKVIQRQGEEERDLWLEYCERANVGFNDPGKQATDFLRTFVEAYESGKLNGIKRAVKEAGNLPPSPYLRLRGVPFNSSPTDVAIFLADFGVIETNVLFGHTRDGKRDGDAYVLFSTPDVANMALTMKQKELMGTRYIELFRSTAEEFEEASERSKEAIQQELLGNMGGQDLGLDPWMSPAVSSGALAGGVTNPVAADRTSSGEAGSDLITLKLRGLPWEATNADIAVWLAAYGVKPGQVVLGCAADGRQTGEAFVVFQQVEMADRCKLEMHQKMLGTRYIEIFKASYRDWQNAAGLTTPASTLGAGGGSCQKGGAKGFLSFLDNSYSKGLTGKGAWQRGGGMNGADGYGGDWDSGYSGLDPNMKLGDALNLSTAMDSMTSNAPVSQTSAPDSSMDSYGVSTNMKLGDVLNLNGGLDPNMKLGDVLNMNAGTSSMAAENNNRGLDPNMKLGDVLNMNAGTSSMTPQPAVIPEDPEKAFFVDHVKQIQRSGQKDREMWWAFCEAKHSGMRDPRLHSKEFLQEFITAHASGTLPNIAPGSLGGVLRLRGVPFSCSNLDVAQFLVDYGVNPDSVVMNVGLEGRLTGEAFVSFPSQDMAERALTEKQRATMGTRYIELFRASVDEWTQSSERAERYSNVAQMPQNTSLQRGMGMSNVMPNVMSNVMPNVMQMPQNASPQRVMGMTQQMSVPVDPLKQTRVEMVKAIQLMGEAQAQLWLGFCSVRGTNVIDPGMHSSEFLDQFLSTYDAHCAQTLGMT